MVGTLSRAARAEPIAVWDIKSVVSELRELRSLSSARRFGAWPKKLPSPKILAQVVDGLSAVLFPNRLGLPELTDEGVDYFVGNMLDQTLRDLLEQVVRELAFNGEDDDDQDSFRTRAIDVVRQFAVQLPQLRKLLDDDVLAAFQGDPAASSIDEVLVCYPGVAAVIHHRIAHSLHALGAPLVARIIAELAHSITGIDIHPGAQIGGSFFIDHGTGVVVGESCIIGERVRLYQAVTLGAKRFEKDDQGLLVKGVPRHPIVEDDVVIYAGATILGRITIGRGAVIGGNVWVTSSVPPGAHVTQAQVRQ